MIIIINDKCLIGLNPLSHLFHLIKDFPIIPDTKCRAIFFNYDVSYANQPKYEAIISKKWWGTLIILKKQC